ncbi:hypothetical protein [Bacillus velezensis]|uniref:hypothetical protein n=1 Tax=Bacillus velezensis TaxID=492670 RepID=UPI001643EED3|nr:hypothetical protein [Bacillus velezensis]
MFGYIIGGLFEKNDGGVMEVRERLIMVFGVVNEVDIDVLGGKEKGVEGVWKVINIE